MAGGGAVSRRRMSTPGNRFSQHVGRRQHLTIHTFSKNIFAHEFQVGNEQQSRPIDISIGLLCCSLLEQRDSVVIEILNRGRLVPHWPYRCTPIAALRLISALKITQVHLGHSHCRYRDPPLSLSHAESPCCSEPQSVAYRFTLKTDGKRLMGRCCPL